MDMDDFPLYLGIFFGLVGAILWYFGMAN